MNRRLPPEERKSQIIRAAAQLFTDNGYENTSVRAIIDAAGISKGGFYYYYESKEELLEDIVHSIAESMLEILRSIARREDLSALEKLNEYIRKMNTYKKERAAELDTILFEMYSGGKNIRLENKLFGYLREQIRPIMKSIVAQGVEEGEFTTRYPEEAADFYLKLFLSYQREISEIYLAAMREHSKEKMDLLRRKYAFIQEVLEKVFGLQSGSLVLKEVAAETIDSFWDRRDQFPSGR